ncbi:MAG: TolC family protein [Novosphingobium sp.]
MVARLGRILLHSLAGGAILAAGTSGSAARDIDDRVPTARSRPPVIVPYGPSQGDETAPRFVAREPIRTFARAVEATYHYYPELLSLRASLRGTDNTYARARADFGPKISMEASHSYQRDRSEITEDVYVGDQGFSSTGTLILSQPLLTFGRNHANQANALAQIAFARDSLRLREAEVLLALVNAYIAVIRDTEILAISRENLRLLERQAVDNTARFGKREITIADLDQVTTRVELGRAQMLAAQGDLATSRARFMRYTGAEAGELAVPSQLGLAVTGVDQALALAQAAGPTIRAAQSREKISRALLAAAKAEVRPRVDLEGSASHGAVSRYNNQLVGTGVKASVIGRLALWDSGERSARIREAEEANDADWRLIDLAARESRESVMAAWDQWQAARLSLSHYQGAVRAAERAYAGSVEQERAGFRTTLDVLDLARDLLSVRTSFVQAVATDLTARAALLAAMGEMEAPRLVPGIEPYDPSEHFRDVARKSDLPLITDSLTAIDGVLNGDLTSDRPIRDRSATTAVTPAFPGPVPPPSR